MAFVASLTMMYGVAVRYASGIGFGFILKLPSVSKLISLMFIIQRNKVTLTPRSRFPNVPIKDRIRYALTCCLPASALITFLLCLALPEATVELEYGAMPIDISTISELQVQKVLDTAEGHFYDLKAKEIQPGKLTRSMAA